MTNLKPVFVIDGQRFDNLEGFWDEVSRELVPGAKWGRNLDALNDILRGGFGTPVGGFTLKWLHADRSKMELGPELFATLVEVIGAHGAGGTEAQDGVVLELL